MLLHFLHLLLASFVFPSSSFTALLAQIVLELCLPAQPAGPRGAATPRSSAPSCCLRLPIPCKGTGMWWVPLASPCSVAKQQLAGA